MLDLLVAIPLAVALLPLMLVIAFGSVLSFRASPLFVQRRLGQHGREFLFVKLRSLPVQTPRTADKYELVTIPNTNWGVFLRKWHLDELPQVWLVITGRMSLVGPRPEMPAVAAQADVKFVAERLSVRPGCTGLWQISTGSQGLIHESPEYDLYYVRNRTLRLDIWVLLRTVTEVLGGKSIISIEDIPAWVRGEVARKSPGGSPNRAATAGMVFGEDGSTLTRTSSFESERRPTNLEPVGPRHLPTQEDRGAPRAAAK